MPFGDDRLAVGGEQTGNVTGRQTVEHAPMDAGYEALLAQIEQRTAPIAPLDIFHQTPAPQLSADMFPKVLAEYATLRARGAGHDPNAYLGAMLAASAAAISDETSILLEPRTDWFERPRLWLLQLGAPGSAKTPAIRAATAPILDLHVQLAHQHEAAVEFAAKDEPEPARKAMLINDATIEKLSDVLLANPRGILAIYEELDSWIGSHDCYRGGQGSKDRGDWLRSFDGGPHQIDRVKRGSMLVPNWSVSILGATTPAGLRRHAKDLPPDGLIQRFLPVIVQPMCAIDETVSGNAIAAAKGRYVHRIRELYDARTGTVRLSADASEVFKARRDELRNEVAAVASFSEPFAGHLAKHAGILGRLALVFHCLECGDGAIDREVSGDTMARAAYVLRQLTRHARAMFDMLAGDNGPVTLARACGSSIVAMSVDTLTRRDLIGSCRAFKDAAEGSREASLRFLIDAAWITPTEDGRQYAGRPANFRVNPEVHRLFAAEGEALKKRRVALRELLGS